MPSIYSDTVTDLMELNVDYEVKALYDKYMDARNPPMTMEAFQKFLHMICKAGLIRYINFGKYRKVYEYPDHFRVSRSI